MVGLCGCPFLSVRPVLLPRCRQWPRTPALHLPPFCQSRPPVELLSVPPTLPAWASGDMLVTVLPEQPVGPFALEGSSFSCLKTSVHYERLPYFSLGCLSEGGLQFGPSFLNLPCSLCFVSICSVAAENLNTLEPLKAQVPGPQPQQSWSGGSQGPPVTRTLCPHVEPLGRCLLGSLWLRYSDPTYLRVLEMLP